MKQALIALVVVGASCAALAQAGSFSTNFESYSLGTLVGQDGWVDDSTGSGVVPLAVVADPTGGGHGQVLKLDNPALDDGYSGAFRSIGDLVAEGVTSFSVSWDQWRPSLTDNLWFAEDISYGGWWGLEWDGNSKVNFNQFDPNSGTQVASQWQTVRMNFNVTAGTVEGFVDGVDYGGSSGVSLATFRGLDLEFQGTAAGGGYAGPMYIDNIAITPEPASALLLGLTVCMLRRRLI